MEFRSRLGNAQRGLSLVLIYIFLVGIFGFAAFGLARAGQRTSSAIVTTDAGDLRGAVMPSDPATVAFRGIPFAAPPIGPLRWRPPAPVTPWRGVRDASELGPACPQPDWFVKVLRANTEALGGDASTSDAYSGTSEDCLNLNVFTANLYGTSGQPVMVWLHGGSGVVGWANDRGSVLTRSGVVVVTVNYRLGILGWLAHPELSRESPHGASGNYGLLDQVAALQWVQRNIARFGGDPKRVTVFGQSSGAEYAAVLMTSPLARGLFQRAIMESGGPFVERSRVHEPDGTAGSAEKLGIALAKQFGAPSGGASLEILRSIPVDRFVATEGFQNTYDVSVDGWSVPEQPQTVFLEGKQQAIPVLIGANANEMGNLILGFSDTGEARLRKYVDANYAPMQAEVLKAYDPPASLDSKSALMRVITDLEFIAPARLTAQQTSRVTRSAYLYEVTWAYPNASGPTLGAEHGIELPLLFDSPRIPRGTAGDTLAAALKTYWTNFATSGDPNGPGVPVWAAYTSAAPTYLQLGASIQASTDLEPDAFSIAERLYAR